MYVCICMYVCMCVCVYVCMYVYVYTYTCKYVYLVAVRATRHVALRQIKIDFYDNDTMPPRDELMFSVCFHSCGPERKLLSGVETSERSGNFQAETSEWRGNFRARSTLRFCSRCTALHPVLQRAGTVLQRVHQEPFCRILEERARRRVRSVHHARMHAISNVQPSTAYCTCIQRALYGVFRYSVLWEIRLPVGIPPAIPTDTWT